MKTVASILGNREIYTAKSGTILMNVVQFMAERNIGAIAIVSSDNKLLGLFSERDLLKRVIAVFKDPSKIFVDDVMTKSLITADPDTPMDIVLNKMKEINIRHMPIVKDGKLLGMVSIRDLMELETQEKAEELKYLNQYLGLSNE